MVYSGKERDIWKEWGHLVFETLLSTWCLSPFTVATGSMLKEAFKILWQLVLDQSFKYQPLKYIRLQWKKIRKTSKRNRINLISLILSPSDWNFTEIWPYTFHFLLLFKYGGYNFSKSSLSGFQKDPKEDTQAGKGLQD
jgi:hypothetical protein